MRKALRDYQEEGKERVKGGIRQGNERGIIHFFTGGGKTVTAIEINRDIAPPEKVRSIMIAPARSLIFQMAQNYEQQWSELRAGYSVGSHRVPGLGVVMGSYNQPSARVIVGSAQTLVDRNIEDYEPIERTDFVADRYGNIKLSAASKRRVLVSERFDEILANGGLPALIQYDECFAAGTLVDGKPIEQIKVGDYVTSFNTTTGKFEQRKVVRLFNRVPTQRIVKVVINNTEIICTENHKFWTKNGWIKAGELANEWSATKILQRNLYSVSKRISIMQSNTERTTQDNEMEQTSSCILFKRVSRCMGIKTIFTSNGSNKSKIRVSTNEDKQPGVERRSFGKDKNLVTQDALETTNSRWQWYRLHSSAANALRTTWSRLGNGISYTNKLVKRKWNASCLQNRCSTPGVQNCYRSGWQLTQSNSQQNCRYSQDGVFNWQRVDNVTFLERTGDGTFGGMLPDGRVYNIEVEQLHTYIANGIIVSNCHHSVADSTLAMMFRLFQLTKHMSFPPINVVGYTATPVRADGRGMSNLFKTIYISRSYKWAQKEGFLVPFADPVRVMIDDGSGDNISLKHTENWTDHVIEALQTKAAGRHVMSFIGKLGDIGGVEASEILTRAMIAKGMTAAHTDGTRCIDETGHYVPLSHRGKIYKKVMSSDIQYLNAHGVGMEGLDLPIIDCVAWLRFTSNDVMKTQAVGRALRLHPGKKDALIMEFTGGDITLNPIGSLFGYTVDPFTQEYVPDTSEEEDELLDGINTRDIKRGVAQVEGKNTTYKIADIISKQNTDWWRDETTDVATVSVSDTRALLIAPPNYTKADSVGVAALDIMEMISGTPNPHNVIYFAKEFARYEAMKNLPQPELIEIEKMLQWCREVYSNFTLWSLVYDKGRYNIEGKNYITSNSSLDTLMFDSVEYMANIESRETAFTERKSSWKRRDKATAKQRNMLKELNYGDFADEDLRKGEASSIINHLKVVPAWTGFMGVIETFLKGKNII